MSDKYSDFLPRFGRNRNKRDDQGPARFEHFIREARLRSQMPAPRPGIKIVVMIVVIMGLGWALQERDTLVALVGPRTPRIRTVIPLAVSVDSPLPYTPTLMDELKAEVTPVARACMEAWPDAQRDSSGQIRVEVVLGKSGAKEAAVLGQESLPESVGRCVGEALGSVRWPNSTWDQTVRFAVVGGALK